MYKGYEIINEGGFQALKDAPCGCMDCMKQVQPGHFLCTPHPEDLKSDLNLDFEYLNGKWVWVII